MGCVNSVDDASEDDVPLIHDFGPDDLPELRGADNVAVFDLDSEERLFNDAFFLDGSRMFSSWRDGTCQVLHLVGAERVVSEFNIRTSQGEEDERYTASDDVLIRHLGGGIVACVWELCLETWNVLSGERVDLVNHGRGSQREEHCLVRVGDDCFVTVSLDGKLLFFSHENGSNVKLQGCGKPGREFEKRPCLLAHGDKLVVWQLTCGWIEIWGRHADQPQARLRLPPAFSCAFNSSLLITTAVPDILCVHRTDGEFVTSFSGQRYRVEIGEDRSNDHVLMDINVLVSVSLRGEVCFTAVTPEPTVLARVHVKVPDNEAYLNLVMVNDRCALVDREHAKIYHFDTPEVVASKLRADKAVYPQLLKSG